jgi:hypothetical protein
MYKLNSTYLDMNNYNVNLSLSDVAYNSEIVISVGHSQLIKWIEEVTGTSNNYLEAQKIRRRIKDLKKLENTSENQLTIKQKYDELYKYQFEENLVSIQFDKKSHFNKCCSGLIINNKPFRRLYGTPGGLKMSTVLFINADIYDDIHAKLNNGRRDTKIKDGQEIDIMHSVAKLEAYYALTSSTSSPVSWPKMIIVKGTETSFDADIIEVGDKDDMPDPYVSAPKRKNVTLEINDGCGIMSPEYSSKINNELANSDEIVSGVCARCAFFKGMLFTFPFKEFAKDVAGKEIIIDAWGHERNVMDADIIATTSQLKLWDSYHSYEDYYENCIKNGYDFRITKVSEELDESRNLNYQFTQSYLMTDDDIDKLISPTVSEIQDIISLDPRKSIVYLAGSGLDEKNVMKSDVIARALMINNELINDPYVRSRIEKMIAKKIRLAKISTIDVDGNFALISGDPYAMCEDIFGMEVHGLLDSGEIFHKFWQDKGVEDVVCMRAPMCVAFNTVKQKIKYSDTADYWFRYIQDCIILNSWDTLRIAESGADCDGDILFTTNNKILVEKHIQLPALECDQRGAVKVKSCEITDDMFAAANKRSFKSNVGSITNIGTSMLNLQSNYTQDDLEYKELEYRTICIQHFQQLVIDSVKNGFKMKPMNAMWNNLQACLPSDSDDDKVAITKNFNKRICAYRKPFFFIYRYNTTKSEYDKYVKKVDSKLKQKYHLSLDELLSSENLTEELLYEKVRFYNKCPVDMSPGTVNRIAWAVNDKFSEFNSLPHVGFDKEVLKSGAQYSYDQFSKVRDVYKEYRDSLKNLAKKTKCDEVDDEEDGIVNKAAIDLIFMGKFHEVCSNDKVLCDILIDLLYDKPNSKCVVWDICGDTVINNLLEKSGHMIEYPEVVEDGEEFSCCRKKFVMKSICVGGENYGEV